MIGKFFKKYKWYVIAIVAVYAATSFWLFVLTDAPQDTAFEYQIF